MGGSSEQGLWNANQQPLHDDIDIFIWISDLGACVSMLAIQYLLLKIHRLRKVLPAEAIPSISELWTAVGLFWILQMVLDVVGLAVLGTLLSALSHSTFSSQGRAGNGRAVRWMESRGRPVLDRVLVSWILHRGLVILLDIIIPFSRDRRRDPQRALTDLHSRVYTLLYFFYATACGSFSTSVPQLSLKTLIQESASNSRSTSQIVRLQRSQTDHPKEGHRNLAWNLVIDKDAMDEMKETLGPPGGFGELGFSVAGDGVRFEAMGVGTSFVLGFEVSDEASEDGRVVMSRRKTK